MIIREKKKRFRIVLLSSGRLRGCACAIVTCEGQGHVLCVSLLFGFSPHACEQSGFALFVIPFNSLCGILGIGVV